MQTSSNPYQHFIVCMAIFMVLAPFQIVHGMQPGTQAKEAPGIYRFEAATAQINSNTAEVVSDSRLPSKKAVALKQGVAAAIKGSRATPDLVYAVKLPSAGRYRMFTFAVTDEKGAALLKNAKTKYESLFLRLQIGNSRATSRVVYVPWNVLRQETGKFDIAAADEIKIWLPEGVRLEYIEFSAYTPPAVPLGALDYHPKVLPPSGHPRLWVNRQSLPIIKKNLDAEEHRLAWEQVKKKALTPFEFRFDPEAELPFNTALEAAAETKAFYSLMTGDVKTGREAVRLTTDYLSHVEFGNLLDVTREIGRAIYTASLVYDWCYDLLTPEEKNILFRHLFRLADDMECGWPPFLQSIVNGHGNEAQLCRDLLSMSIAVYDEDPLPYRYCAYTVLEQLVPMRAFEYQSPRHNQGILYGDYRFRWDMHAAWLLYRMSGQRVFDANIQNVRRYWQYMRLPDGQLLRDGDGVAAGAPDRSYYWKGTFTALLNYAYAADPVLKDAFMQEGGLPDNPVLFLLLNDPALKPENNLQSLPLTIDFGRVLGGMIARTGWNMGADSRDVVAEIKGGGYHFANHQHSDAGALQLYYRGLQLGDIGVYAFYGTPYDFNFNKRSVAHSMMLAVEPGEKFGATEANDGGTRFNQRFPKTPEEVQTDSLFRNGEVRSADFGPSKQTPAFSYFQADLTSAYSKKMERYTRAFCFLNMQRPDVPAVVILADDMTTAQSGTEKIWQVNTLHQPEVVHDNLVLQNRANGVVGKTLVTTLLPKTEERTLKVLSGENTHEVFAHTYQPPPTVLPEARAHRVMISPVNKNRRQRFLNVLQVMEGEARPLAVDYYETAASSVIVVGDRVVSVSNTPELIGKDFSIRIPSGSAYQVLLTGLAAGQWDIRDKKRNKTTRYTVTTGKNTLSFQSEGGAYSIRRPR